MKLLWIFFVFTIFWCDAFTFVCRYYDESSKSLEIYCKQHDQQQQKSPDNCTREIPSLNSMGVTHLKIEGCYQSYTNEITAELFDVSYSGYRSVDWSIDASESIIEFDASFNELIAVPKAILRKYPRLETIDLSYNSLTWIYDGDFKSGQKLQEINLSHNLLVFIEANAFANLNDLHFIDLKDNQFSSVPVFNDLHASTIDFEENAQLSTFDCLSISIGHKSSLFVRLSWEYIKSFYGDSNCRQWKFNVNVQEVCDLQGVYMGHPPFNQIDLVCNDKSFQNLEYFVAGQQNFHNVSEMLQLIGPSVWKIDVRGNYIGELDAITFQRFRFLRELSLSDALTAIDISALNNLKLLNRLDLSMNQMEKIDNSILLQYFGHLIDFNAAENKIWPENIDEILRYLPPSLQRLNLSGNNVSLAILLNRFERFTALKYLNLSNTGLSTLDASSFKSLRFLVSLDVSYNNLNNVNFVNILNSMDRLKELRAANTQITNISGIFEHLGPSLQILDLSENHIGPSINASLLQTLCNLTSMNLSKTHLENFNLESLKSSRKLRTLDLSHNQLQNIDLKELPNFTQLEYLYLNENDLIQLDNFKVKTSSNISFAIGRNQMSCSYLRQLNYENSNLNYIGSQLDQKHGTDCRSSKQGIKDFLGSVYEKLKFW